MSALATLFSWRASPWRSVGAGLDSWQAGLAIGFEHHLQWGPQLVFTFGPYGFVEDILPYYRLTAVLALLYAVAVSWGIAALAVKALRSSCGLLPAGVITWGCLAIAANLMEAPELALALAFGLALAVLSSRSTRARLELLGTLGTLAGFQLLVEVNVGLVTAGLAALAAVSGLWSPVTAHLPATRARWQGLAVVAGSMVGTLVVAWAAASQSLGNLASYFKGSLSIAAGYASAMGLSAGRQAEDWYALVVGLLTVTVYALGARGRPLPEKVVLALMVGGLGWEAVKEGFVRHDMHDLTFFGLALAVLALARLPRRLVALQVGAIGFAALVACIASGTVPAPLRSPRQDVSSAVREVQDLSSTKSWALVTAKARRQLLASGDTLPPQLLDALAGKMVAALPWEDGLTYVYPQLHWDPEPVLQAYSAYTAYLDSLDASFLSSARAPQKILYQVEALDGRDPWSDPPATLEAMYCHYVQAGVSGHWQLLRRVANRCGPPRTVGRVSARFGEPVRVPPAHGEMVTAAFSLSSPLLARAQGALLKPPPLHLTTWSGPGPRSFSYRFVPGTARGPHVLAVPASLGYSPAFSPPTVRQVEISGGGWKRGQGHIEVTFYALSMAP